MREKNGANSEDDERHSRKKLSLKTNFVANAEISGAPDHYG